MLQLYPILIVAVVLFADSGFIAGERGAPPDPTRGLVAALGPPVVTLLLAAGYFAWQGRRLRRGAGAESILAAERGLALFRWLLLLGHAVAVIAFGWLATVRAMTGGNIVLVDELIAIAPPLLGLFGLWWLHYPIERRLRDAMLVRRLDEGRPVYRIPGRARFVVRQFRLQVALLLVPVLAILACSETVSMLIIPALGDRLPPWTENAATLSAGLLVFLFAPFIARHVLSVVPLTPGPVHDDLDTICRQHRVRVRRFLVWRTDGSMINAAVMGLIGPVRYVLLTDALLESLDRQQVRAVMAHEIGHVRLHHMAWLVGNLLAVLVLAGFLVTIPVTLAVVGGLVTDAESWYWTDGIATALAAVLALAGFGFSSRRFERHADTFAVRHLTEHAEPAPGEPDRETTTVVRPEAVDAMCGALDAIARLNGVSKKRRSWRHGSIAWRESYLRTLLGRPLDRLPVDRVIRRLQVLTVCGFVAGVAGFWWLDGVIRDHLPPAEPVEALVDFDVDVGSPEGVF